MYHVYSQSSAFETIIKDKRVEYRTKNYSKEHKVYLAQDPKITGVLSKSLKIPGQTNLDFIKNCLSTDVLNPIKNKKSIIAFRFMVNQNGKVLSCSLVNFGEKISLSDKQIECILKSGMEKSFNLIAPNNTSFRTIIMQRYVY